MSGITNGGPGGHGLVSGPFNMFTNPSTKNIVRGSIDPSGTLTPDQTPIPAVNLPSAPTVPANTAQSDADAAMQALRIQSNGGRASTTLTAANGTLSDQDKAASKMLLE